MTRTRQRVRALVAAAGCLAALSLAACTFDGSGPGSSAPPGAVDEATSAADAAWASAMAAHHDQAVALAALADGRAADPEVIASAGRIASAQAAEATALRAWLAARGVEDTGHEGDGREGDEHDGASMPGEISSSTLERAESLSGSAFDRLFVETMIRHHEGAVDMCETRLEASGDPAITRWVRTVAASQGVEIDRLREIDDRLG
ncbi:DUF305 domain-containing protein [Agromyces protaetiae]|uniref:DUF305 domain-containing protein n=1 Tax=Agromyces protaetiae TaxID=2509455 RepID=A0A4P6FII1_9MICO|nr:DUF305 domain-containing protein [Agromyces protaetiae]QAY73787.1 DUF305 domain-containing protein [Agromyces protaetiae]